MGIKRGCRGGAVEGVLKFTGKGGPRSRGERKGRGRKERGKPGRFPREKKRKRMGEPGFERF